jgi:PAS domain S-box-containing protein
MMGQGPTGQGWEHFFWLLFEQTTTPVIVVDESRNIVEINEAALALFGRSRGEVIGTSVIGLLKPSELAKSAAGFQELLKAGEYEGTRTFVRPDGTEVTMDMAGRMATLGQRRLAIYVTIRQRDSWTLTPPENAPREQLTPREREIVTLIALGRETQDIAEELTISPETVRTHVRNAMAKLEVHTRAALVAVALCNESAIDLLRLE